MNDIREIVTKAVIGKGNRKFEMSVHVPGTGNPIDRVLGAFMTNHRMNAIRNGDAIEISGTYDVHCWYTYGNDIETDIVRTTIDYGDVVALKDGLRQYLVETDEITAEEIIAPHTTNIGLDGGVIVVESTFEVGVEVIGETKMRVAILGPVVDKKPMLTFEMEDDDLSEIDTSIKQDFLEATIEPFE